jgi:Type I restriction enzyme R protein N terminus (HSDR_N)
MLTSSKKAKLLNNLKVYSKKYLNKMTELDESGTRLMVNHFLTEVLGFIPIEEVKTEYMIRGTYADYVIQCKAERQFLVEVKALSFALSEKHLRQAINYGANEGIEWALLTNGKSFQFYKILFNKPIESRKVFEFDLSDASQFKLCVEVMQYITKDGIMNKGLAALWSKTCALDPVNVAGLLFNTAVTNFIKRTLKNKFKSKFGDDEINASLKRIIHECIPFENLKIDKAKKKKVTEKKEQALTILEPAIDSSNERNLESEP